MPEKVGNSVAGKNVCFLCTACFFKPELLHAKVSCGAKYFKIFMVIMMPYKYHANVHIYQTCFLAGNKYNNQSSLAAQKSKDYAKENTKLRAVTISLDIQDPEITRIGNVDISNYLLNHDYHPKT